MLLFIALNYRAYDGFFQDDELDNLSWAPYVSVGEFVAGFAKPLFDVNNFRPVGHLYFVVMMRLAGEDFPPYITPIWAIHLLNALLLFFLIRRMKVSVWHALAGVAFFTLSASAFDAYWKPMYVFDLLCTFFCLSSILLYSHRRWVLSFVAFWCAYKAKELAVMLPVALLAWEYWLGERQYLRLLPFFAASFSFGLQGVLLNPNRDNEYTFRFTWKALTATVPFYAKRFLLFPWSGLLLPLVLLVRDRRVWFGVAASLSFLFTLLFLPGRLFEAYIYLPLACATIAMTAAASHVRARWAWLALAAWLPLSLYHSRAEQKIKLAGDDEAFAFVDTIERWAVKNPAVGTLVYEGVPRFYHDWGVTAAWNLGHHTGGMKAWFAGSAEGKKATASETVAYGVWDSKTNRLSIHTRSAGTDR